MPAFHGVTIGSGVVIVTPAALGSDGDVLISKGDGTSQWADSGSLGLVEEAPNDGSQYARKDLGWEVVAAGGGEANTSSNDGAGVQLAKTKDGVDLPFRTLVSGDASVTLTQNADEIDIRATGAGGGEANVGENVGGAAEWYVGMNGVNLQFRTVQSSNASVVVTQNATDINLTASAASVGADPAGSAATVQAALDLHEADADIHFADAPTDGEQYAREDGSWVIVDSGGVDLSADYAWTGNHSWTQPLVINGNAQIESTTADQIRFRNGANTGFAATYSSNHNTNAFTLWSNVALTGYVGGALADASNNIQVFGQATTGSFTIGLKHASNTAGKIFIQREGLNAWAMTNGNRIKHGASGNNDVTDTYQHHIVANNIGYGNLLLETIAGQTMPSLVCRDENTDEVVTVSTGGTVSFRSTEKVQAGETNTTIDCESQQHQTLDVDQASGDINVILTAPAGSTAGTVIVSQGATPRNLSWSATGKTVKWLGTEPTWNDGGEADKVRIVSWRYDNTTFYLVATSNG